MKRILLAGESWTSFTTHVKGFDSFFTATYGMGADDLIRVLKENGYEITYLNNEVAADQFPTMKTALQEYDLVILSDIGSNTLLLTHNTFTKGMITPNRCKLIREYVEEGGALLMIGGYMSFTGIDAKARYGKTELAEVLPVSMLDCDDRVERPEGIVPQITNSGHPVVQGIKGEWPQFLGYNRVIAKPDSTVVAKFGADPFIVTGTYGKGRAAAFTSDCAPHWGSPEFVEWKYNKKLWGNLAGWLCKKA